MAIPYVALRLFMGVQGQGLIFASRSGVQPAWTGSAWTVTADYAKLRNSSGNRSVIPARVMAMTLHGHT